MADHYEEGARYTVAEDMPRWCGCFIHQGGTEVLKRKDHNRPAPVWIGNTETDLLAGDVVTVTRQDVEGQKPTYNVVKVGDTAAATGTMFG